MDQMQHASEESNPLDRLPKIEQPKLTPIGQIDEDDAESAAAYQSLMRHRAERRRKKIVRIAIVAGVVAAIVLFNFVRGLFSHGGGSGEVVIPTEFVYRDDFRESISGTGSAKPSEQVTVATGLTGEVLSIDVAVGDTVFKTQPLMTIENDSLDTDADEAWFKYKEAEAAENTAQEELNYVWGTSDDQAERDRVYIALMRARAATQAAYDAYEQAAQKARDRTVRSPIDGTVISLGDITVGQQLGAPSGEGQGTGTGQSAGIQIANLSQMTVAIEVSEIDITKVEVGQHAVVTFSALPGVESEAYVTGIATLSSGGGEGYYYGGNVTYTVTLLIEHPDPQLKPGMSASVRIDVKYLPGALCVSTSALMTDDGTTYYLLVKNPATGEFERRTVTVVAEGSTTAVIDGAVAEGDEVQVGFGWTGESGSENEDGGMMVMF